MYTFRSVDLGELQMNPNNRREPVFKDGESESPAPPPWVQQEKSSQTDPFVKIAMIALTALALVLIGDKLLDRYIQYRATQELVQGLENFQADMESTMQSINEQSAERTRAQRQQRANSTTGKWLAKNCADWRRSYETRPTETAQSEMQTHCRIYQNYLANGIAPPGAPR